MAPLLAQGGHAGRLSVRLGLESILALLSADSLPAPPPGSVLAQGGAAELNLSAQIFVCLLADHALPL